VPLRILPPLVFGSIVYFMLDLEPAVGRFLYVPVQACPLRMSRCCLGSVAPCTSPLPTSGGPCPLLSILLCLPHDASRRYFLASVVVINVAATMVCYVVSTFTNSVAQSNVIVSLIFVFNILFGGLLLTARTTTIEAIMRLSLFNWGWQASVWCLGPRRRRVVAVGGCMSWLLFSFGEGSGQPLLSLVRALAPVCVRLTSVCVRGVRGERERGWDVSRTFLHTALGSSCGACMHDVHCPLPRAPPGVNGQ
jgi:hypothetical protein